MKYLKTLLTILKYIFNPKFIDDYEREINKPEPTPEPTPTPAPVVEVPTPSEMLYEVSKKALKPAHDVSPEDKAVDELACVESLWNILNSAFFKNVGFSLIYNTIDLKECLDDSSLYKKVDGPELGAILVYVSGTGNGTFYHGHTFICGKTHLMSNDSKDGFWKANHTYKQARDYWEKKGGFKPHYYKRIK